ncbi:SLAP domain-containing protein [Clostridium sp. A1-XYC3]|uniref:SLAP domain-containing protein n=1 Tax=Clostridium tanneri TaxID=3037988 RepID=A0ABU4JVM5_9CLOT|nr:SLAP domain-containing protein [Clostridium sp. A1-XYC3]MDW8802204.1 SLAP domain-containing protein [Clostridium sp. A1-XYC3]
MKNKKQEANSSGSVNNDKLYVSTVLSLLDHDENVMSDVQKEILEEEIAELPKIVEGQLNVTGIYAYDQGEKFEIKAYIRNGLSTKVTLGKVPFYILDSKDEVLGKQMFNLQSLGELPPHSARPVKLYFEKKNVKVDAIPIDNWKLAFDSRLEASRTVKVQFEDLPEDIDIADKLVYDNFLNEVPDINEGEISVSTFSIGIQKNGNILVTLVVRNGNNQAVNMEKIPVTLKDPNGTVVKSELFKLDNFTISPLKARICNLVFPTGVKVEEDMALNNWTVSFKLEELGSKS